MPIAGGAADKFGNRYEGRWTVASLARVLSEEAVSLRLEPWDESGDGVEFALRTADATEYHQVKRQAGPGRQWTVRRLTAVGVLPAAKTHLTQPAARFVFVSMTPGIVGELTERARHAGSADDLAALVSGLTADALRDVTEAWEWDRTRSYEALRRLDVVVIDELRLLELAVARLRSLVAGDTRNVIDVLSAYALDHVHQEIRAPDLWSHLRHRGFTAQQWWRDASVLGRIDAQHDRYMAEAERLRAGGAWIPREEVTVINEALSDPNTRVVVVSGSAGVGKTSVLTQLVTRTRSEGTPTLPFRVDRLVPTQLPDNVGEQLGLPSSPAATLAGVAPDRTTLLVIDQLDAVSVTSGRNQQLFEVIAEVLREAEAHPFVRVVVACRQYDLENDPRLRQIREDPRVRSVQLGPLAVDQVRSVLEAAGYGPDRFVPAQIEVLRIPLNLRLFLEAAPRADENQFASSSDLYGAFWEAKARAVDDRLGRHADWLRVIDALCEEMNHLQSLSASATVLDQWPAERDAMVSEGVLVLDRSRVAFAHEGFFDYSFARRFAARGGNLLGLLRSEEQRLFRRAQARQILLHARDAQPDRYIADLRSLLSGPDIRFHVKDAVLTLIGAISDPTDAEWGVAHDLLSPGSTAPPFSLTELIGTISRRARSLLARVSGRSTAHEVPDDVEAVRGRIRASLVRSAAWFDMADGAGWFDDRLESRDEGDVDLTIRMLAGAQRLRPARVAEIVSRHQRDTERWRARCIEIALRADLTLDRAFFEWFLARTREGSLDGIRTPFAVNGTFWDLAYALSKEKPEWAAEFAEAYLRRRDALAVSAGVVDPFDNREWIPDPLEHDFFTRIARGAASAYLSHLLPWMLEIMARTTKVNGERRYDAWSARFRGESHDARAQLVAGMEVALEAEARTDSTHLAAAIDRLVTSGHESADFLAARAFTFSAAENAIRAANWVLADPRRLAHGYLDSPYWVGRELIAAIWPHLDDMDRRRLEESVFAYVPAYERTAEGRRARGRSQFVLLSAVSDESLSPSARRRIAELRRKFGQDEPEEPRAIEASFIGPPIPQNAAAKLTDDQWVQAITKYDTDTVSWTKDPSVAGGVHQLSGLLHDETVRDPTRFANLALRLDDDVHPSYFEEILRGLGDSEELIEPDLLFDVCRRAHSLPGRPCGRWITYPIRARAGDSIPDDILDLVAWYATEADDPRAGQPAIIESTDSSRPELLVNNGINSARGAAAETVAGLLWVDHVRLQQLQPAVERLANDAQASVRSCAADIVLAVYRTERPLAATLFEQLASHPDDALLATPAMERSLMFLLRDDFTGTAPVLRRMLNSSVSEVVAAGGRQAVLASLSDPDAQPLADEVMSGTESQRLGAAQVFAANLATAELRAVCVDGLKRLFNDPAREVREAAARCFYEIEPRLLAELDAVVAAFIDSPAFADQAHAVFHALSESPDVSVESVLDAAERFVQVFGAAAGDIRTSAAGDAHTVSALAVRAHTQAKGGEVGRALDLIDHLLRVGAYGMPDALDVFER